METTPVWVGIDVAKAQLDIAIGAEGESWSVPNDEAGIDALLTRLRSCTCGQVVLEATGGYEVPVVSALARAFPSSSRTRGRSATSLARPASSPRPIGSTPLLKALLTRRRQISGMIVAERNRQGFAPAPLKKRIETHIRWLQRELDGVDADLGKAIQASPVWRAKDALYRGVPGIGPVISRTLIANLPELGHLTHREIAALVGLAPLARDSGTLKGKRMVFGGRAAVRVLPAPVRARQAAQARPHRMRPQAAHHLERYGSLGRTLKTPECLTSETVANAFRNDTERSGPPMARHQNGHWDHA